jgi:glycosyl-4,4'-diaponeurosporenoate acyltransferase
MWIELPAPWIIALNVASLPLVQIGCAYAFTRLPDRCFDAPVPPRPAAKQAMPAFLRKWKRLLPDGASWFAGGFRKRSLASRDPAYLRRFIAETRRGESCHWVALGLCAIPFLWNPWWGCVVIAIYAVAANLPCILLQRINRARLLRLLARGDQTSSADAKSARS